MSIKTKQTKEQKSEYVVSFIEKVDIGLLERMISADDIDSKIKDQLKQYYYKRSADGSINIKYAYSKVLKDKGRLYAKGGIGLQSFKKEIRHNLARDFYHDVDMENAHPRFILQYCEKNGIECERLRDYVENREERLTKIMEFHEITRDQAKTLMLRLCYLGNYKIPSKNHDNEFDDISGIEPENKLKKLIKFQEELRKIAKIICGIESDVYEIIKSEETKINKVSACLSITAQMIEDKCLGKMSEFFSSENIKVGVLCFDGLMIEKCEKINSNLEKILKKCEKYVLEKTGYAIKLAVKPMDKKLSFELPQFAFYVNSDRDCQEKLFKIVGKDKFQYCKGQLYVFNEDTGMYDTAIETLFSYLNKNNKFFNVIIRIDKDGKEKCDNYGDSAPLQHRVVQFVKTAAKDDEWLDKTQNTSLGYLLFKNGIYNMKKGEFTAGFDPKIVFHYRVPWDYTPRDKKEVKKAMKISFDALFEEPRAMIIMFARALAGDIKMKKFVMCPGRSNAGKSKLINMLTRAFGGYIGHFNAESLACVSGNDTRDEAAKMRWALLSRFCRILLSSEVKMDRPLDGNALKKHASGGDRLTARTHGKEEESFIPHYTMFFLLNDIPKISPMDQAVDNRAQYIEFPYVFYDPNKYPENPKKYEKQGDLDIEEKIESDVFIRGFIHIILDGYKDFLENGMPEFDKELKEKWTADNKQNIEIKEVIYETFDITGQKNDTVKISDIKKFKERNKDIFQTISTQRFNEILEGELKLSVGKDKKGDRCWNGIKLKENKNTSLFDD